MHSITVAALLGVIVAVEGFAPNVGPVASTGSFDRANKDKFRKGYTTNTHDVIKQADSDSQLKTFDRENNGLTASKAASIGVGPFGGVADGARAIGLANQYDRGVAKQDLSRVAKQHADSESSALDVGNVKGRATSDAAIDAVGYGPSIGSAASDINQHRHQDISDRSHVDQSLVQSLTNNERYDRGVNNANIVSQAAIADGALSTGASQVDFAHSRDRAHFVNTIPGAGTTTDSRQANVVNHAVNDASAEKATETNSVIGGVFGGAAGESANIGRERAHQRAFHHDDVSESHGFEAGIVKNLDSDWAKGTKSSSAGIDGLAGASSGLSKAALVVGHDRSNENIDLANNAHKATSATSKAFDDRDSEHNIASSADIS